MLKHMKISSILPFHVRIHKIVINQSAIIIHYKLEIPDLAQKSTFFIYSLSPLIFFFIIFSGLSHIKPSRNTV